MSGSEAADLDEILKLAKEVAQEAGEVVIKNWGQGVCRSEVELTKSGAADLVTVTDQESEKVAIEGSVECQGNWCTGEMERRDTGELWKALEDGGW